MSRIKNLSLLHWRIAKTASSYRIRSISTGMTMGPKAADRLDAHVYTSGRWLYRDELQQEARYKRIDFDALCKKVVETCPGARSIASYDKKEGGFNRVFIFKTDNGKHIVARLPFMLAGPPRLTTASEVATIRYLQQKTTMPIPKIIDWNDDDSNKIGSEYIIMEHATGVQLHQRWSTMGGDQQVRCINNIYQMMKEMVDMPFPSYGSLYLIDTPFSSESKKPLDSEFCIGPHCGAMYWNCNVGESRYYVNTKPNQGPWPRLDSFCDGLIDAGISRVPPVDSGLHHLPYHGSVETHLGLLASCRTVIKKMSKDPRIQRAAMPTLFHPDLHKRNIFVSEEDPTIVTAIIDWQSASIEPAFWYADEIPDFASVYAHPTLQGELEPGSERCAKTFDVCTRFLTPKLSGPRLMNEALFRPFRYCYRTWKDGAVALRHELIQTSQQWKQLGFAGLCPFTLPETEELAIHCKEYRKFEAAHDLKGSLSSLLDTASDGWVPTEDWKSKGLAQRVLFDGMLQAVLSNEDPDDDEPIRNENDLREIWPFDL